ncbi:DUF5711 family protein [Ruminococcus sp.]|uniref:DUF5711 family protein n=1 Tax=Ruminococcus sp. TaxID=41978 RepID=UPI0025F619AB|nr:DUF5711 family protein [Ruminococcus sp.]MBQ8965623.1 hypothetical protein [Ruminococcus sp.]
MNDKGKERKGKNRKKRPESKLDKELRKGKGKVEKTFDAITEQEVIEELDEESGEKTVTARSATVLEENKEANRKKNRQAPAKKKVSPPRDEAAIARESIKHTRTGGIPDENEPPRRRRRSAISDEIAERAMPKKERKAPSAEEIREARQREKNKKRIKTAVALLVVAVFAFTAYFTRKHWVPQLEAILNRPKETIVNDGEVKKGNFPLGFDEGSVSSIANTGSYLLCLDKNQLKFYDEDGAETSAFSHNYADPIMKTSDKRVLLYDKGGSSLMVVGRKNEMFSKAVKNRLIMAELADNNNVAVVTSDERYGGILTVYDGNGREIYKWSSSASLISVTFDKNGDGCYVTTYSGSGGTLSSVVRYLKFDSEEPAMISEPLPCLALQALENDNGEFWVAGDTAFYRLDRDGKVMTQYSYKGRLKDFDLSRDCAAVTLCGVQRRSSELLIFDSDTQKDEPDHIVSGRDGEPERVKISGSKIILLKARSINCYDHYGNLVATAECSSDYIDFVYFGDNVYFCDLREVNKISFTT